MENKLKIHTSFYLFLFFVIYFNGISLFLSYFLALFLHEYSHYLLSNKYSKMSGTINIYPFGMNVNVNTYRQNRGINFLIFLIGPLTNILLLLITTSLWWHFPVLYYYTKNFALANLCLGLFNLIPIYPLDGGNMILQLFRTYKAKNKALGIMKILAIIFAIFFMVLFIFSCFSTLNFSCFCISSFMFSSIFTYKEVLNNEIKNRFSNEDVKEYKAYIIKFDTKFEDIKKCFDNDKYVQFYILNDNNKIVKIMSQDDIVKAFSKTISSKEMNEKFNNKIQS